MAIFEKRPGLKWLLDHAAHEGDACLLWPFGITSAGYGNLMAFKRRHTAHRYMCELVKGPPPSPDHQAAHGCGNTKCVNPHHLSWKTASDNQLDRHRHGTIGGPRQKLTESQVVEIRRVAGTETPAATAARYLVTAANIRQIQAGKTWRHVNAAVSASERGP